MVSLVEAKGHIISIELVLFCCFLFVSNYNFSCTKEHPRIAQLGYYIKHFANREMLYILLLCFGSNTRDEVFPSQEALVQPARWPKPKTIELLSWL